MNWKNKNERRSGSEQNKLLGSAITHKALSKVWIKRDEQAPTLGKCRSSLIPYYKDQGKKKLTETITYQMPNIGND